MVPNFTYPSPPYAYTSHIKVIEHSWIEKRRLEKNKVLPHEIMEFDAFHLARLAEAAAINYRQIFYNRWFADSRTGVEYSKRATAVCAQNANFDSEATKHCALLSPSTGIPYEGAGGARGTCSTTRLSGGEKQGTWKAHQKRIPPRPSKTRLLRKEEMKMNMKNRKAAAKQKQSETKQGHPAPPKNKPKARQSNKAKREQNMVGARIKAEQAAKVKQEHKQMGALIQIPTVELSVRLKREIME